MSLQKATNSPSNRAADPNSSLIAPRAASDRAGQGQEQKRPPEVNVDSAVGQPYVLYEGTILDTVLMNRLDGDAAGPVKVLVSNPVVFSRSSTHYCS